MVVHLVILRRGLWLILGGFTMKRFSLCLAIGFISTLGAMDANASTVGGCEVTCIGPAKVLVGYTYEVRYKAVKAGLFGCRVECVPVCCKVPVYMEVGLDNHNHVGNGIAPDINNESGIRTRTGQ
jgi:hypothetical protein